MTDFVLRHGNDLLALESLKGFDGDLSEQGRILRVGDLTIIDGFAKHRRKVFLFENSILFCKTRKSGKSGPTGSDVYDYKQLMRVSIMNIIYHVMNTMFVCIIINVVLVNYKYML